MHCSHKTMTCRSKCGLAVWSAPVSVLLTIRNTAQGKRQFLTLCMKWQHKLLSHFQHCTVIIFFCNLFFWSEQISFWFFDVRLCKMCKKQSVHLGDVYLNLSCGVTLQMSECRAKQDCCSVAGNPVISLCSVPVWISRSCPKPETVHFTTPTLWGEV